MTRGENSGATLRHDATARMWFGPIPLKEGRAHLRQQIQLPHDWRRQNLQAVAFVQELGGAMQWHFAAMWLLVVNGIAYLALNFFSGRWRRQFFPLSPRQFLLDLGAALKGQLTHADPRHYNTVQATSEPHWQAPIPGMRPAGPR